MRKDVRHGRNVHPLIWMHPHLSSLVDDSKDMSEKSSSVDGCGQEQDETIYNQDETGAEVDSIFYFITEACYLVTACCKISTATVIKIWPQQYYKIQWAI